MEKKTKNEFKIFLNEKFKAQGKFENRRANGHLAKQKTREYGDYLYSADKDMFDMLYARWVEVGNIDGV